MRIIDKLKSHIQNDDIITINVALPYTLLGILTVISKYYKGFYDYSINHSNYLFNVKDILSGYNKIVNSSYQSDILLILMFGSIPLLISSLSFCLDGFINSLSLGDIEEMD